MGSIVCCHNHSFLGFIIENILNNSEFATYLHAKKPYHHSIIHRYYRCQKTEELNQKYILKDWTGNQELPLKELI